MPEQDNYILAKKKQMELLGETFLSSDYSYWPFSCHTSGPGPDVSAAST